MPHSMIHYVASKAFVTALKVLYLSISTQQDALLHGLEKLCDCWHNHRWLRGSFQEANNDSDIIHLAPERFCNPQEGSSCGHPGRARLRV